MQRHTMTGIIIITIIIYIYKKKQQKTKKQQKHRLGTVSKISLRGLNRLYVATNLALSSIVAYTRHLFSPREWCLTHQCNIYENIQKLN